MAVGDVEVMGVSLAGGLVQLFVRVEVLTEDENGAVEVPPSVGLSLGGSS